MSYINRLLTLPFDKSFFLFGARNVGKSTLLQKTFAGVKCLHINLLKAAEENKYSSDLSQLSAEVLALDEQTKHIIIDEIQKVPRLLDEVHALIESTDKVFVMTGSSARKLRYGGANLLAGRALVYNLYPLTSVEIEAWASSEGGTKVGNRARFDLNSALRWGTLPTIVRSNNDDETKELFLQTYAQTYLKEEVWMEQFVRKLEPFRKFLEVSAQCNGQIVNYANIAKDVGTDEKTIQQYFSILEDTLIGFFLEPFHHSFRKRLNSKPKFYYFDTGVVSALSRTLSVPLMPSTAPYGNAFEHFIILEAVRLASYYFREFRFSYLRTKDDVEIDLIVERPGQKILFIEIKSSDNVTQDQLTGFARLVKDFGESEGKGSDGKDKFEALCFSRDIRAKKFGEVLVLPWAEGLRRFFVKTGV